MTEAQHSAFHDYYRSLGFYTYDAEYVKASQRAWKALSEPDRRLIVAEGMRRAGLPESLIQQHLDNVMKNATPGLTVERKYGQTITAAEVNAARQAERSATKVTSAQTIAERQLLHQAAETRATGFAASELQQAGKKLRPSPMVKVGVNAVTGVALAGIMAGASGITGFSNSKHCMAWYARTMAEVQKAQSGQPCGDLSFIRSGSLYDKAKDSLEMSTGESLGLGGGISMMGAGAAFANFANKVHDELVAADSLNQRANPSPAPKP